LEEARLKPDATGLGRGPAEAGRHRIGRIGGVRLQADRRGKRIMTIDQWLQSALADADRRGLPGLKPLLEALARATKALRAADFNDDARK